MSRLRTEETMRRTTKTTITLPQPNDKTLEQLKEYSQSRGRVNLKRLRQQQVANSKSNGR